MRDVLNGGGGRCPLPLVSVVVPAYNVAEYVRHCLQSLEDQDYERLEIVVVDDGSTDGTGEIIEELAGASQSRIRHSHQPNAGLSGARNSGLARCEGQLVVFVDGDDVVAPCFVSALVQAMLVTGADVASCGFQTLAPGARPTWPSRASRVRVVGQPLALTDTMYDREPGARAWAKMARRELWAAHPFPDRLLYEDLAVVPGLIADANKVAVIPEALYGFAVRPGSITRMAVRSKNVLDLHQAVSMAMDADPSGGRGRIGRSFRARELQEACRVLRMVDSVGDRPDALARYRSWASRTVRSKAWRVAMDRRAPLELKLRGLLALLPGPLYGLVWRAKKRAEGWHG